MTFSLIICTKYLPSWKKTKEVLLYKDDMKPFFKYVFHQLAQYKTIMKRKQH